MKKVVSAKDTHLNRCCWRGLQRLQDTAEVSIWVLNEALDVSPVDVRANSFKTQDVMLRSERLRYKLEGNLGRYSLHVLIIYKFRPILLEGLQHKRKSMSEAIEQEACF